MFRTLGVVALLAHASGLAPQRMLPLELQASDAFSSVLSQDCEIAPGKLIMMTEIESEYLDNQMFANWYGSAHRFLNDKVQFLFDMPDDAAVEKMRKLQFLPADVLITNKDMEIVPLFGENRRKLFKIDMPNGTSNSSSSRRLYGTGSAAETEMEMNEGHASQAPWGSSEYKALMRRRPSAVLSVLKKKCTILHFDIDTYWKKNALAEITDPVNDMLITDDSVWNERDMAKGTLCGCFLFFKPASSTIKLAEDWIAELDAGDAGKGNQKPLNHALLKNADNVKVGVLAHSKFPPGKNVRKKKYSPKNVVLYHANWVKGVEEKLQFLQDHDLWHPENADKLLG